jgi:hypothetical protein
MIPLIGSAIELGMKILDRVIPDPAQRAQAQLDLLKLQQEGAFKELDSQLQVNLGQIEVNKVEAASENLYKAGWRPGAGWVCVGGLFYEFIMRPLLPWLFTVCGATVPPLPSLDSVLFELVFALLGLGGLRQYGKAKGIE